MCRNLLTNARNYSEIVPYLYLYKKEQLTGINFVFNLHVSRSYRQAVLLRLRPF